MKLQQPPRGAGYRTNADAFLLARFAQPTVRAARVYDLGAGVGAIGLSMLHAAFVDRAVLVERDAVAVRLAEENARQNGYGNRTDVVRGDVLEVAKAHLGRASLVVCNPPYIEPGRGRAPKAGHRDAKMGSVGRFVEAARLVLGQRGKAFFVYPAAELCTFVETLRESGLEPKRMLFVHPRSAAPARVVLVQAQAGKRGGLFIEAPVHEH